MTAWKSGESTTSDRRVRAGEQLVRLVLSFDEVYARLRRGRPYRADVDTGRLRLERAKRDGVAPAYQVVVPANYGPDLRHPVQVYLHGRAEIVIAAVRQAILASRPSNWRARGD
jgi:hypothetical protein